MTVGARLHLVIMGVAGSGKSTVAALLAQRLGWPMAEADEFHPPANISKMSAGAPLSDADRWPWLGVLRDQLSAAARAGHDTVLACSALRRAYRDVLRQATGQVRFVHLAGAPELITQRLHSRREHFMPPQLLPSQYQTLEPLGSDEAGLTITVEATAEEIAQRVLEHWGLGTGATEPIAGDHTTTAT